MTHSLPTQALICIDYINEMVSPEGKLSLKGYLAYVEENNTLLMVNTAQELFRNKNLMVIHVKIAFSSDYNELPTNSILLGKAKEFGALQEGKWGTEFQNQVRPIGNEKVIIKRRISAFFSTDLELTLKSNNIDTIYLAGVATDIAVESAARDAHDRGFNVNILSDCCAAANSNDQEKGLSTLRKISNILTLDNVRL